MLQVSHDTDETPFIIHYSHWHYFSHSSYLNHHLPSHCFRSHEKSHSFDHSLHSWNPPLPILLLLLLFFMRIIRIWKLLLQIKLVLELLMKREIANPNRGISLWNGIGDEEGCCHAGPFDQDGGGEGKRKRKIANPNWGISLWIGIGDCFSICLHVSILETLIRRKGGMEWEGTKGKAKRVRVKRNEIKIF